MCLYIFVGRFSVGLRRAQLRCAALCNARFLARFARYAAFCIARFLARFARYAAFCIARFLARFARYAAFCIARFLARCMSSNLSLLRSGLPPSLLAVAPTSCLPRAL